MWRPWLLLCTCLGCHALDDLENCQIDRDCPLGERCHPEGKFCERDTGPVRFGATLALTGELGDLGSDMATGLELAATVVNEAGGVRGRPIVFEILDDAASVEEAETNVRTLLDGRVAGVVGPMTSAQAVATQSLTFAEQLLHISPTAGAPELSTAQPAIDRYFFRTISTVRSGSAAAMALFAKQRPDRQGPICHEMAILHTDDAIGVAYRDALSDLFVNKLAGCISTTIDFPSTQLIDYDPHVTALIDDQPNCAAIVAFPEAAVEIMGELERRTGSDPSWNDFFWLGTTSLHGSAFIAASENDPNDPAEGVYGGDEDSTPETREYRELRDRYNAHFGRPPATDLPIFVSNTYDAAMLVALAVHHAEGTSDRVAIRDGLWAVTGITPDHQAFGPVDYGEALAALARGEKIHYKGASSQIIFDEQGTVSNPAIIWKIENDAFVIEWRYSEEDIEALLKTQDVGGSCP